MSFALVMYVQDHRGHYPDAARWETELMPYLKRRASDPPFDFTVPSHPGDRMAMNVLFSGKKQGDVSAPCSVPLLYETRSSSPDASGTPPWPGWYECDPNARGWRMAVLQVGWTTACTSQNRYLQ